jgi:hypothetical protein
MICLNLFNKITWSKNKEDLEKAFNENLLAI